MKFFTQENGSKWYSSSNSKNINLRQLIGFPLSYFVSLLSTQKQAAFRGFMASLPATSCSNIATLDLSGLVNELIH